ncbi:dihydrofolate reductase [Candidatus Peregrinibacteria bacterium]|nr:MAG: dihydrofolate reductase [Candidatus Peregrinibacteria bacterium]
MKPLYLIVATDEQNGIGKNGDLPWRLKNELVYFQKVTSETTDASKQNMVVMGRTTWESIPENRRPLKNRKNVVLTRQTDFVANGATVVTTIDDALALADDSVESIFVIGGASVYEQFIAHPDLTGIYLTRLDHTFDCDAFFPEIPKSFGEPEALGGDTESEIRYNYLLYRK